MKIAFVGKGGSGKSTISSLFIRYLQKSASRSVLAIDADLNMNLSGLLGVKVEERQLLSKPEVASKLRHYFRGTNPRIKDESQFLPTTPPGAGSNLIASLNDSVLDTLTAQISKEPHMELLTVGSYDSEGIGQTCYHSHLFVAENLLSHTVSSKDFAVVCDMVAGTDAFAYSMHLQFDAIVLIAEPTPESTEVCKLYLNLGKESGVDKLIHIVGNKIEDDEDLQYIRNVLGKEPLAIVKALPKLKKARQKGEVIGVDVLDPQLMQVLKTIESEAIVPLISPSERLKMLHSLHQKLNEKKWVELSLGDVSEQIDPNFQYEQLVAGAR